MKRPGPSFDPRGPGLARPGPSVEPGEPAPARPTPSVGSAEPGHAARSAGPGHATRPGEPGPARPGPAAESGEAARGPSTPHPALLKSSPGRLLAGEGECSRLGARGGREDREGARGAAVGWTTGGASKDGAWNERLAELSPSNFAAGADSGRSLGIRADLLRTPAAAPPAPLQCTRDRTLSPRHPFSLERAPSSAAQRHTPSPAPPVHFRGIEAADLPALQQMHEEIFPIAYELDFFLCVVHRKGVVSWAACEAEQPSNLIGFVTARMMDPLEAESTNLLQPSCLVSRRTLMYILTLGVKKGYRQGGIASALVGRVVEYARSISWCQGVFLHVVAYNTPAIRFYTRLDFVCLRRAPSFYALEGRAYDAYVFALYVNGGQPHSSSLRDGAMSTLLMLKNSWKCLFGLLPRGSVHGATASLALCNFSGLVRDVLSFFTGAASRGTGPSRVLLGNFEDLSRVSLFQDRCHSNSDSVRV